MFKKNIRYGISFEIRMYAASLSLLDILWYMRIGICSFCNLNLVI